MAKSFFGIDELWIFPITKDDATGTTYGAAIRAEGATSLEYSDTLESSNLEGDNGILESSTIHLGGEMKLSNIAFTFEQIQAIRGGVITTDETSGVKKYVKKSTDEPEYFGAIAVIKNQNAKRVFHKCKISSFDFKSENKTHAAVEFGATVMKRDFDDNIDQILLNDSSAATAADFE
jgi:hypothetical protein